MITRPKVSKPLSSKERLFIETVWDFYDEHARHDLPWRTDITPYRVLVSELMLQQTQVQRVIPKYETFIKMWPSSKQLAAASLGDVLINWQGLGYNRRAKYLYEAVQMIERELNGVFPERYTDLLKLPGVGPYTAEPWRLGMISRLS